MGRTRRRGLIEEVVIIVVRRRVDGQLAEENFTL